MRTTITLEPDVVELIEALRRERRITFKQAVNEAIRAGLAPRSDRPFVQQTYSLGVRPDIDLDRARHLADALEDQEIIRKLARGA
jgi:hypothetical protein